MKVAYVTVYDSSDVRQWSGLGKHIAGCLVSAGFELDLLGPLPRCGPALRAWLKSKGLIYNRLLRGRYGSFSSERDRRIARLYADAVARRLPQNGRFDLIVSPGSIPVAFLSTSIPIVIWQDATFHSLVNTYPGYSGRRREYYEDGERLEQAAFRNASLCIFSSAWAAESALTHYQVERDKVSVIPFGANFDEELSAAEVEAAIAARPDDTLRLLFMGMAFERKGGPKVLQVLQTLLGLGVRAQLHIIGCSPEIPTDLRPYVTVHRFISKENADGRALISRTLIASHWLILLSVADCTPLVLSEANSRGVPCIASAVGGIPSIIRDGHNGKLFPADEPTQAIAEFIRSLSFDRNRYMGMANAAYQEYLTRLNWRVAGSSFRSCVDELFRRRERYNSSEMWARTATAS